MSAAAGKRLTCASCLRPQRTCICRWITPTTHSAEVVVLQHPLEVHNAKGSARLLHLSLPHSRLLAGEVFAEQELQALLTGPAGASAPGEQSAATRGVKHAILLYPATTGDAATSFPPPTDLSSDVVRDPSRLRLIVLDGT